uniref:FtsX-like permease family protein n=1 Tax=Streptomyces nigrescens TaxID=1920 RepID=UPI0027E46E48|nr:FtsX-like permease family protein [Streptomyces libani]
MPWSRFGGVSAGDCTEWAEPAASGARGGAGPGRAGAGHRVSRGGVPARGGGVRDAGSAPCARLGAGRPADGGDHRLAYGHDRRRPRGRLCRGRADPPGPGDPGTVPRPAADRRGRDPARRTHHQAVVRTGRLAAPARRRRSRPLAVRGRRARRPCHPRRGPAAARRGLREAHSGSGGHRRHRTRPRPARRQRTPSGGPDHTDLRAAHPARPGQRVLVRGPADGGRAPGHDAGPSAAPVLACRAAAVAAGRPGAAVHWGRAGEVLALPARHPRADRPGRPAAAGPAGLPRTRRRASPVACGGGRRCAGRQRGGRAAGRFRADADGGRAGHRGGRVRHRHRRGGGAADDRRAHRGAPACRTRPAAGPWCVTGRAGRADGGGDRGGGTARGGGRGRSGAAAGARGGGAALTPDGGRGRAAGDARAAVAGGRRAPSSASRGARRRGGRPSLPAPYGRRTDRADTGGGGGARPAGPQHGDGRGGRPGQRRPGADRRDRRAGPDAPLSAPAAAGGPPRRPHRRADRFSVAGPRGPRPGHRRTAAAGPGGGADHGVLRRLGAGRGRRGTGPCGADRGRRRGPDLGRQTAPRGAAAGGRQVPGVVDAVPLRIDVQAADDNGPPLYLVIADAEAYSRLARATGLGAFAARDLADPGGDRPLPALVSPRFLTRFGHAPMALQPEFGQLVIRPKTVRADTPAQPGGDFVVIDAGSVARRHPDTYRDPATGPSTLLLSGRSLDTGALRSAVRAHAPASLSVRLALRSAVRAEFADSPLQQGAVRLYTAAVAAGAGFALLALFLSLLQSAPERTQLLARLRTMGLPRAQGRRLLVLEALPQAVLAALGGALAGAATIRLLGPGTDLTALALPGTSGGGAPGSVVRLHTDPASLLLPSAGVVALALTVALAQAWLSGRRRESTELRAGDTR